MPGRKNGYYICYRTDTDFVWVDKKIDNQVKVFNSCCKCQKIAIPREKKQFIKSVMWRMPFGSVGRKYEYAFDLISQNGEPDFLYVRFAPLDRKFIKFLRELRNRYASAKILLEIPTYPYKAELLHDITMFPFYFKDIFYRGQLKEYIDRVVTLTDDRCIYGIPTIRIINGIIVDDILMENDSNIMRNGKEIRLLAVAVFQKSHGYERVIKGLAQYYKGKSDRIIEIHLVGCGAELKYYKKLVLQYKLEKYVFFYGRKTGEELDKIYSNMDIALGSFGSYKRGIFLSSALKIREYLAKGLPIVSGCVEDIFENESGYAYYLQVANDNSIVDMKKILYFYDQVYGNGAERQSVHDKIREFAKRKVDIKITMQPIIQYILQN